MFACNCDIPNFSLSTDMVTGLEDRYETCLACGGINPRDVDAMAEVRYLNSLDENADAMASHCDGPDGKHHILYSPSVVETEDDLPTEEYECMDEPPMEPSDTETYWNQLAKES